MAQGTLDRLTDILEQMTTGGSLSSKTAEEAPRPGGQADDKSSHPTTDTTTDGLTSNPTGQLARQDASILSEQGQANIADKSPVSQTESQEETEIEAGLKRTGIGNDPAVENAMTGTLAEPGVGTSHPAQFDDGAKYAADFAAASPAEQQRLLSKLANEVLAELLVGQKTAAASVAPVDGAPAAAPTVSDELLSHAQQGYAAAKTASQNKTAAAAQVLRTVVADAQLDAMLTAAWLQKVAADDVEAAAEDDAAATEAPKPAAGGDKPAPSGDGGGDSGPTTDDLMAATAKAPAAESVNPQDAVAELAAALTEMGITPEMLEQLASGGGMGGGDPAAGGVPPAGDPTAGGLGGMPAGDPAMGGMPPAGDPAMAGMGGKMARTRPLTGKYASQALMIASRVRAFKQAGGVPSKAPATPRARQLRALSKQALDEMLRS